MKHLHINILDAELAGKPLGDFAPKPDRFPVLDALASQLHQEFYRLVVIDDGATLHHVAKVIHCKRLPVFILRPRVVHQTDLE